MKRDGRASPADAPPTTEASSPARATLDEVLDGPIAPAAAPPSAASLVAECVDARHPTLRGRILARWQQSDGSSHERWVPTLQGLPVRAADRVLLLRPSNDVEWLVIGVVDGFAKRPEPQRDSAAVLELPRDRAVRVEGSDGQPLVEIFEGESGPVVRLLHEDLELATPGRLRIKAREVQMQAEQGAVEVSATDDVIVRGEVVRLN